MSGVPDKCHYASITLRRGTGIFSTHQAWRHGNFGVVKSGEHFVIVHADSGVALCGKDWGSFKDLEAACACMVKIQLLRGEQWSKECWETMQYGGPLLKDIVLKHGGGGKTKGSAPARVLRH